MDFWVFDESFLISCCNTSKFAPKTQIFRIFQSVDQPAVSRAHAALKAPFCGPSTSSMNRNFWTKWAKSLKLYENLTLNDSGAIQMNIEPERKSQNLTKNQYIFKGYPILYEFLRKWTGTAFSKIKLNRCVPAE
jgi:hypothetical protein